MAESKDGFAVEVNLDSFLPAGRNRKRLSVSQSVHQGVRVRRSNAAVVLALAATLVLAHLLIK